MDEMILFYDKKVNDLFYENNQRIFQHLASLSCQKILDTDIKELAEEIYQDHKLNDISLDMEKMKVLQYDSSFMKVGIPIREGKDLMGFRPTNEYGSVHPVGAIEDDWVTKIFSFHDNMDRVKKNVQIWKDVMDLYSNNLDEDMIHYHKHLLKDIEDMIRKLRDRCNDLERRVKTLSTELNMK
jgi:hypothetical protein